MKYRWKETDEGMQHKLCLLIDHPVIGGRMYEAAYLDRAYTAEHWTAFISGFIDEEQTPVEGVFWEDLHDAKKEVLAYIKVWWVTGTFQRMNEEEREAWENISL